MEPSLTELRLRLIEAKLARLIEAVDDVTSFLLGNGAIAQRAAERLRAAADEAER